MATTKLTDLLKQYKAAKQAAINAYRTDDDDNFVESKTVRQAAKAAQTAAADAYNSEMQRLLDSKPTPEEAQQLTRIFQSAGLVM